MKGCVPVMVFVSIVRRTKSINISLEDRFTSTRVRSSNYKKNQAPRRLGRTPQLARFISRTPMFEAPIEARVCVGDHAIRAIIPSSKTGN